MGFRQSGHRGGPKCQLGSISNCSVQPHWLWESPPSRFGLKGRAPTWFSILTAAHAISQGAPPTPTWLPAFSDLTDDYVYGDEVTPATFISMSYSSGDLTLDITNREALDFYGGLNADGSFNAPDAFSVLAGPYFFGTRPGNFTAFGTFPFGPYIQNAGSTFTFT